MNRTIENPVVKDKVTFIKTAAETGGKLTWISVTLAPRGGNQMHYHDKFTETFIPTKGTLGVDIGKKQLRLKVGERKTIPLFEVHRFYNPNDESIEFEVKIEPASRNFEEFLQIMYGLARDGKVNKNAIPTNIWTIGAISQLGETLPPKGSILARFSFIFKWLSKRAAQKGVLKKLREAYVEF